MSVHVFLLIVFCSSHDIKLDYVIISTAVNMLTVVIGLVVKGQYFVMYGASIGVRGQIGVVGGKLVL